MSTDEFFISRRIAQYREEMLRPFERAFYGYSGEDKAVRQALGQEYIEALDRFLAYLRGLAGAPVSGIVVQMIWAEAEKDKAADLIGDQSGGACRNGA